MWNNIVPGVGENFYSFALWFLVYSVMGWFVETIYMSFCNKRITNRGFIHGPICPIYGFGGILVHSFLRPFEHNWLALFLLGMLISTTIEYITARLMISIFGCIWWDYSNKPFNYKGIICLESCVAWGLYTIIEFAFLKNMVFCGISRIPYIVGKLIITCTFIYYMIDFTISAIKSHKSEIEDEPDNNLKFSV